MRIHDNQNVVVVAVKRTRDLKKERKFIMGINSQNASITMTPPRTQNRIYESRHPPISDN